MRYGGRWVIHVVSMGETKNVNKTPVGKQSLEMIFWSPKHGSRRNHTDLMSTSCTDGIIGLNWHMAAPNDRNVKVINLTSTAKISL
jgi:hypothetical protein